MARLSSGPRIAQLRRLVGRAARRDRDEAEPIRFSIVLPIFNSNPGHLVEQLHALGDQRFADWECLVVDDGSTDRRGVEAARSVAARDERFIVYPRPGNGGIAAATNDGLRRARNPWIVFCDHDDVLLPDALQAFAEHIEAHPDDDLVYTDEELIAEDGSHIVEYRKPDFSPERLLGHNYICHAVAVRRSLVEQIGGLDATYEPVADNDFDMRAVHAARHVGHIPTILYRWRSSPGSLAAAGDAKGNVAEAVLASASAQIERRGLDAHAVPGPDDPTLLRIHRPVPDAAVEEIHLGPDATAGQIDRALRASDAEFVALAPGATPERWYEPLVAICAQHNVAVVGPKLTTSDGRLVSAGRVHHPSITDLFQGIEADNPGPWGAFCVNREVASIAAPGAVLHRVKVLRLGGLDLDTLVTTIAAHAEATDRRAVEDRLAAGPRDVGHRLPDISAEVGLDLAMAALGTALWQHDMPAIWTPLTTLTTDTGDVRSGRYRSELAHAQRELARSVPDLFVDPYSPVGVHHR